jgi:hypothetical protein
MDMYLVLNLFGGSFQIHSKFVVRKQSISIGEEEIQNRPIYINIRRLAIPLSS